MLDLPANVPISLIMKPPSGSTRAGRACGLFIVLLAAAVPMVAAGPPGGPQAGPAPAMPPCEAIAAFTKPSGDVTLAFPQPGRIARVLVKEGQLVEANQLLIRQDDSAEQVQVELLKSQAESNVHVMAAKAQLAQKAVDYEKFKDANKFGATPAMEVEHARLDVDIARLSLELAELTHDQDVLKYREYKARVVGRMRLESPIAGRVEKLVVREGETRDAQQPVIRIVNIDPLWVDVPVPLRQARALAAGGAARVEFYQDPNCRSDGNIVHVADVADAASDTLLVRVEIDNPALRKAGERVGVIFPPPPAGEGRPRSPATLPAHTKETH